MSESPLKSDAASGQLLEKLRDTPGAMVTKKVASVDQLTPEDVDGHGRWLKSQKKKVIGKLHSWFMHFLFVVMCCLVLVVAIGGVYLTCLWVRTFISDPVKLGSFIYGIWNVGLVALATLFINGLFPRD